MAESASQTRISRYIGLYSAESTIALAKSSLRLFLGSALGKKLTADTLEVADEQYFAGKRDYQADVETFFKSIRRYVPRTSMGQVISTRWFCGLKLRWLRAGLKGESRKPYDSPKIFTS